LNKYSKAKIKSNVSLKEDIYLITLETSSTQQAKPGQFYILRPDVRLDPFLGRPLSVFEREDNVLKFLYRIKGKGTKLLSNLNEGDLIQITGPLGKGYPLPKDEFIVIAGGIGLASVYYLIKSFPKKAHLFYGVRNKEELLFYDLLKEFSKELCVATECGSLGYQGVVTEVFSQKGLQLNLPIYACGPMIMIKEIGRIIEGKEIPCYVAVEERMACGVGACLGCVIPTNQGFKRVCTEGPVFDIKELIL